jgi:hypothetical protein
MGNEMNQLPEMIGALEIGGSYVADDGALENAVAEIAAGPTSTNVGCSNGTILVCPRPRVEEMEIA